MPTITTDALRPVVEDFAKLIREKRTLGQKPGKAVINFRSDRRDGRERDIWLVPINCLRFRKDNGRIASDVTNYEKINGPLNEKHQETQEILKKFLEEKDDLKTEILMSSIVHTGQNEVAIITCDGFLINGNRRKMVFEKLLAKDPGNEAYKYMKVVILPADGEPGGRPTLLEIEQLENRYQLQSEGKADYYGFDRAISIKRKIDVGYTLEAQLRDDPQYALASDAEIKKAIKRTTEEYIQPLECINRYLEFFDRPGLYSTVSSSRGDREGRWQAFKDYSDVYYEKFRDQRWMMENGVDESDIGEVEEAAFKIIKLRNIKNLPKVHVIMRKLHKLSAHKESRKELLKICNEVVTTLPAKDCVDAQDNPLSIEKIDEKWAAQSQQSINHRLKKSWDEQERNQDTETPIALLEAAYGKLTHEQMTVSAISVGDYDNARQLASDIQKKAKEIEAEIYYAKKNYKSLSTKK